MTVVRIGVWFLGLAAACSAVKTAPAAPVPSSPQPALPPAVEKMREVLEVLPLELFFSGQRGKTHVSESVTVRNKGDESVEIMDVQLVGTQAASYQLSDLPRLPLLLRPTQSFVVTVAFAPPADAAPGVHHARLRIVRGTDDDGPPCDLSALVTKGTDVGNEPSLASILETLGYGAEIGETGRTAAKGQTLIGGEIRAPSFVRAKPGNVGLYLVARYSPAETASFGYWRTEEEKLVLKSMGTVDPSHNQTLNPELEGEGQTSFDPGESSFGIYVKLHKQTLYSDHARNAGKHAIRVYPLRGRGGQAVPDALVAAVDEDGDGDLQDYVFLLWNAKPAPQP